MKYTLRRVLAFILILVMLSGVMGPENFMMLTANAEQSQTQSAGTAEPSGQGGEKATETKATEEEPTASQTAEPTEGRKLTASQTAAGEEADKAATSANTANTEAETVSTAWVELAKDLELRLTGKLPEGCSIGFEETDYKFDESKGSKLFVGKLVVTDRDGGTVKPSGNVTAELKGEFVREMLDEDETFGLIVSARGGEAKLLKAKDDTVSFRLKSFGLFVLFLKAEEETVEAPAPVNVSEQDAEETEETVDEEIAEQETDGEETDGEVIDGKETDGKETDGEGTDGKETDGEVIDGEVIDGKETDGEETDGEETDGEETDGEVTDGKEVDGEGTDGEETDGEETDGADAEETNEESEEISLASLEISREELNASLTTAAPNAVNAAESDDENSYRFEQATVYLKDILSAVGAKPKNNSKISVTPDGLITLSDTTYKNKNANSITLTANEYFDSAVMTIGSVTITLSYPDPDESIELVDYVEDAPLKPEVPANAIWANDVLYLTGKMPANAVVDCVPVEVEIDGEYVIAAYDIKIYANANQKAKGKQWQPAGDKVQVHFFAAENEDAVHVYHMADAKSEAELVDTVTPENGWVSFEAEHFSVYGFSFFEDLIAQTIDAAVNKLLYKDTVFENDEIILTGRLPRNAIIEAKKVDIAVEGLNTILAYDIKIYQNSFFKALGIVWQPKEGSAITVREKSDAFEGLESVTVYHMADENATPEYVTEVDVQDDSVTFEAESFSIYPIGEDPENARIAYRFWYYNGVSEEYQEITTQYFRYKDVHGQAMQIYEPSIPGMSQENFVRLFQGWFKATGPVSGKQVDLEDEAVTVAKLNEELEAMAPADFVEGTIIDIVAQLRDAYYITYVDVNPNSILGTDLVVKEETGETTFRVKDGVKPTRYEEDLKGWKLVDEIADPDATMYVKDLSYPISENITLAPVIEGGYWLVFNDNDLVDDGTGKMVSGGASYTPPAFYVNNDSEQQSTVQPPDPEWTGYAFDGWYEDSACTMPFTFGSPLTKSITVYAKWVPAESSYTVIIWKQPTDPKATSYDFDQSFSITTNASGNPVKTGDLVYLDPQYTKIYGQDGTSADNDKQYFVYNQDKTDQYIIVKANGGAVMNVYYDRVPMTISFYTWDRGYVYTETTADTGTQYGIVNGEYVQLSKSDSPEDVYHYQYSPAYVTAPDNLGATYQQYGIIDGEYKALSRQGSYSFSYHPFNTTTGTAEPQYALVDGEYVRLTRVDNTDYTWTPRYTYTAVAANDTQNTRYGIVNGQYVSLTRDQTRFYITSTNEAWPGTRYAETDLHQGTCYGVVNGQLVQLTRAGSLLGGYYWTYNGVEYNGPAYTVSTAYNNTYAFVDGQMLGVTRATNNFYYYTYNGEVYSTVRNNTTYGGTRYSRANYSGAALADGTTRYKLSGGSYVPATDNDGTQYYFDGKGYVELTRSGVTTYFWQYTRDDVTVTLPSNATRYTESGINTNYSGTRSIRSGANWWEYQYTPTTEQTNNLFGVDDRGGHVALNRSSTANSYAYYYGDTEYTGTRYYAPNQNPVDYSGAIYTLDNGTYHVTTENSVNDRYGIDGNGVFRSLVGSVDHPDVWGYYTTEDGETVWHPYSGTRYTRSSNQQNSWQLYKQFVGVYGATLEQYGYEWPGEYNWYETGYNIANGGNANGGTAGNTGGTRMTLKTTFEPLDNNLNPKYYADDATTTGKYLSFLKQNLDGTYTEADRIYLGGTQGSGNTSFSINDKYTGFHAATYRVNGSGNWTSVGTKDPATGVYGNAVSFSRYLEVRFDRTDYDLVFFTDPGTGAEPITYSVPYGASLSDYADQSEGQKMGYYFLGWFADDAYTTRFDFSQTMPDHPVSVYAYWRMERVRVIIVPGADNVSIDPGQAMSFRLNYDEQISDAFLMAATRAGYTLDGWYTDPTFPTNARWMFSTPVRSGTDGVDSTYQTSPRWASTRESYGDNTEEHSNVRGVLVLYARWLVNTSEKGVNIVYDPGAAAVYDGLGNSMTTVPVDPRLYQDGSDVVVGAAPSGYSDLYHFDYWEIVDSDGHAIEVDGVASFYTGTTFNVGKIAPEDAFEVVYDDEDGSVILKTIKLRAHYTKSAEAEARYTAITYDGDTLIEGKYPSGTKELHGRARDGSLRTTVTLDKEVNATIILPNETDFFLDGYTLAGWSFFQGTYDDQIAQANTWNTNNPDDTVPVQLAPAAEVAADNLKQNDTNDEANTLYAMWQPKTYKVTLKQVVEDGVPVSSFTYNYKSGVENAMPGATRTLTLNGDDSETFTNLSAQTAVELQYYGRVGHVFNITPPTIPDSAEYAVRVNATVLQDDGTVETLPLNNLGNYEIRGDVTITFTYALKVPVTLEKKALNDQSLLTGSKFVLTPVEWNSTTKRWVEVGSTTFDYDMSSVSSMTRRLQEGIYRVNETQAPTDFAMMGEPLLLTVRRDNAFLIRTTAGGGVGASVAQITGTDGHTLTIFDRPIRTVTIKKLVDGTDLGTTGYTFSVQLTLEGSEMNGYDTVGDGNAADTTSSAGIIEFKLKHNESKTLRVPWGSVIQISENDYPQFKVSTASAENVADLDTENDRIYRCTVDKNDTITFTNKNVLLTVSKEVTGAFGDLNKAFTFTLEGLVPSKAYHLTLAGRAVTRTTGTAGTITFELKHGESMVIPLIEGESYKVIETPDDDYKTSVITTVGSTEGESEKVNEKTVQLTDAITVKFTNNRPPLAPTGVTSNTKPFGTLLLFGLALALLSIFGLALRKRNEDDDGPDPGDNDPGPGSGGGEGSVFFTPTAGAFPDAVQFSPTPAPFAASLSGAAAESASVQTAETEASDPTLTAPHSGETPATALAQGAPGWGARAREIGRRAREKILSQVILTRIRPQQAPLEEQAPKSRSESGKAAFCGKEADERSL